MISDKSPNLTPLMRQFYEIKNKYPDTLLLFQVGDFYEIFFEDAKKAATILGIALTQRGTDSNGDPIPLCGVPVHVLENYLSKLVKAGIKVAICDQLESIKPGKIIERGVTQVLTPGTLTDLKLLNEKSASYLAVFYPTYNNWALIFVELLTGQLFITWSKDCGARPKSIKLLEAELGRFLPDEIVLPDIKIAKEYISTLSNLGYAITCYPTDILQENNWDQAKLWLERQFAQEAQPVDLLTTEDSAVQSCILLFFSYLKKNNERALSQLKQLFVYKPEDYLMLDAATQRNLELVKNLQDGSSANTLFNILDDAATAMGSRTIKKWLLRPLVKQELIEQRFDAISNFKENINLKDNLRQQLSKIGDLERVVGRIVLRRAQLHDYTNLLRALEVVPEISNLFNSAPDGTLLSNINSKIDNFCELNNLLNSSINCDTSLDWLIKSGFNSELDRLREISNKGTQAILEFESKEQKTTGINTLKIRFNGPHGYGIEVTKANMHLVPAHYMRLQTLVNRERYTTQELKDLEYDLQRAKNEITQIEKEIFESIKQQVETYLSALKKLAYALSYFDALAAMANVAYKNNYVRPQFNSSKNIKITDGRHPVVQSRLANKFIPNSTNLTDEETLWIITGPNMGGKSTYLRQVALISIMAQMGSFVPAKQADLPVLDKIFTRIGAADNVAEGKSTFLVEMEETALICNEATENSLVILDEVGRGTSTFDGLAIAQAVVEYIFSHVKARCLFATHYHELTILAQKFTGIVPYYAASTKTQDGIVLLHKILPGVADGSFGLEVAKLAQLPESLVKRANEILNILIIAEQNSQQSKNSVTSVSNSDLSVTPKSQELEQRKRELEAYIVQREQEFEVHKKIVDQLKQIDCEQLTAKQALDIIWRLKDTMA